MPSIQTVQDNFTQGELSQRYIGRLNNDLTRAGLAEAVNAVCLPQGPIISRMGTRFVEDTQLVDGDGVTLWPFFDPDNNEIIAFFTESEVRLIDVLTGSIVSSDLPYSVQNANYDFNGTLNDWLHKPSYYINSSQYFQWITATSASAASLGWHFNTDGAIVSFPLNLEDFLRPYLEQVTNVTDAEKVRLDLTSTYYSPPNNLDFFGKGKLILGTTQGGNDLGEVEWTFTPNQNYDAQPLRSIAADIPANGPNGYTGELWVRFEFLLEEPASSTNRIFASSNWNVRIESLALYVQPFGSGTNVSLVTPYSNEQVNELHFVQSPVDNRELVVLHPLHPPQMLYKDPLDGLWKFEVYDISPYPSEWIAGNYPSVGAGFQGRLWLTGAPQTPEIIWASSPLIWKTISPAGANAGDPLQLISQVRTVNTWLFGFKDMLFGDVRNEYAITSQQGPIAPGDAGVRPQSGFGSLRMPQKALLDKYILINGAGNTEFRLLFYNERDGGYLAPDQVLKAEHLGKRVFKKSFYTREPHQIMWSVMDDGSVCLFNFDTDFNLAGWTQLHFSGQVIDGCAVIRPNGETVVMLVVRRIVDGDVVYYLERIENLRYTTRWLNMDCTITRFVDNETGAIDGFDALEGELVSVFIDGHYEGEQIVSTGTITTEYTAQRVDVGIPFNFKITTFPQPTIDPETGINSTKRYSKIGVRGLYSLPPIINGVRPPDRSADTAMDTNEPPLQTEDSHMIDQGRDHYAQVTIEEPLPLQVTVSAIFGKITGKQL